MRRAALLGALLLAGMVPVVAGAQFGGLSKLKDKVQKKAEAPEEHDGAAVPAKVGVEWTVETFTQDKVPRGGLYQDGDIRNGILDDFGVTSAATRTFRGSVSSVLRMGRDALPGGPMSRAAAATNPLFVITFASQSGVGDLVSLAGKVTHSYSVVESGAPCKVTRDVMGSMALTNPGKLSGSGEVALDAKNTQIAVGFKGDAPGSVNVMIEGGVAVRGRVSGFPCAGVAPSGWSGSLSKDRDYSEPPIGVTFAADMEHSACPFQKSRAGTLLTLTGRCERTDGAHRTVTTITLTWDAPPPPSGTVQVAAAPTMEAAKGTITFTQNGKKASWLLGSMVNVNNGPVTGLTMMFTPDGGQPSEERGVVALSVMNVMGRTMIGMNVAKGPAGDTAFEGEHCTGTSSTNGGRTTGSGECKHDGDVFTFTFTAIK